MLENRFFIRCLASLLAAYENWLEDDIMAPIPIAHGKDDLKTTRDKYFYEFGIKRRR